MKLIDEEEISEWAFYQCKNGNDTIQMRRLITNIFWIQCYCNDIKNLKEMRYKITNRNNIHSTIFVNNHEVRIYKR